MDLLVCGSLHHFRGQNTCGAVEGRERLIELAHTAADAGGLLYDIDFIACVCNVERGLDACNTAADDERALCYAAFAREQRRVKIDLCDSRSGKDDGLFGRFFHVLVDPGAVLTDVCNLDHVRVEAGSFRRFAESRLVHTRGAGTNHKTGQVFFADGFDDLRLADLGAHVLIIFRVHDTRFMTDHFYDFLYIYRSCDVAAAMAHKYTNSLHAITSCIF